MRKLKVREDLNSPQSGFIQTGTTYKINFALNSNLVQEVKNWLRLGYNKGYFATPHLGAFIKRALVAYQHQLIELDFNKRTTKVHRANISICFSADLLNYYLTLPKGRRVATIELALLEFYKKERGERVEIG